MIESESKSDTKITNLNPKTLNSPKGIPCSVVSYEYDKDFILAIQKPNDCLNQEFINNEGLFFWIIDISKDKQYGPLVFEEYLKVREKIGIPATLRLKL